MNRLEALKATGAGQHSTLQEDQAVVRHSGVGQGPPRAALGPWRPLPSGAACQRQGMHSAPPGAVQVSCTGPQFW